MYVKIVRGPNDGIYECHRFLMSPVEGTFRDSNVTLESNQPNGSVSLIVDRTSADIYVMNADGRTIERYLCLPPPPPDNARDRQADIVESGPQKYQSVR